MTNTYKRDSGLISNTLALKISLFPLSLVGAAIFISHFALSLLLAFHEAAYVIIAIWPGHNSPTVLLAFFKVSFICIPIFTEYCAESMIFIILPVSSIDVAIRIDHSTLSVSFVVFPPALIERAITIDLGTTSFSDCSVNGTIDTIKKQRPTILHDILPRLAAKSLFERVFFLNSVVIHQSQNIQVDLEFSKPRNNHEYFF